MTGSIIGPVCGIHAAADDGVVVYEDAAYRCFGGGERQRCLRLLEG